MGRTQVLSAPQPNLIMHLFSITMQSHELMTQRTTTSTTSVKLIREIIVTLRNTSSKRNALLLENILYVGAGHIEGIVGVKKHI